jgi:protein involved in polysaccharide export with SLBB domain
MKYLQPSFLAALVIGFVLLVACANPVAHVPEFPSTALAPQPVPRVPVGGPYKLIPYDQISIRFPYHSEVDPKAPIPIQPDGNISLDGVGTIQAAGLSPEELAKAIADKSSDRLRDPQVVVTVTQYAPRNVYVGGEVKSPGIVAIQNGMTPMQAIFDRGGFTDTAQTDSVILIRDAGSKNPQIGRLNLVQAMENAVPERITLVANDVLYVPQTGIGRADLWVRQHLRDIIPWEWTRFAPRPY